MSVKLCHSRKINTMTLQIITLTLKVVLRINLVKLEELSSILAYNYFFIEIFIHFYLNHIFYQSFKSLLL